MSTHLIAALLGLTSSQFAVCLDWSLRLSFRATLRVTCVSTPDVELTFSIMPAHFLEEK